MSDIAPFFRLCCSSSASSAFDSTSTMAFPIAVTSNWRLFIGSSETRACMPAATNARRVSGALQVLADQRRQVSGGVGRNRLRTGDQRVLEGRGTLARALERQAIDSGRDDLLRRLRVLHQ